VAPRPPVCGVNKSLGSGKQSCRMLVVTCEGESAKHMGRRQDCPAAKRLIGSGTIVLAF
jgi:hypothetical protein